METNKNYVQSSWIYIQFSHYLWKRARFIFMLKIAKKGTAHPNLLEYIGVFSIKAYGKKGVGSYVILWIVLM